jgi:ABC-type sugar transport system ATPase subunit
MTVVLEAKGIEKRYGATLALRDVDFALREGEVHALLGENGAGKSTLSKILAGVETPDRGEILLRGDPISIANPAQAQVLGIGMVSQELDLFPHLTVAENMATGNAAVERRVFIQSRSLWRWCEPFLKQVGLELDPDTPLRKLSVSHRQLVAIARALSMRARVILMDEPTSSLSEVNVEALFAVIDKLKQSGVSIAYISHKMEEIQRVCDRITVMRDGSRVATLKTKDVTVEALITLMAGRRLQTGQRAQRTSGDVILNVRSIKTEYLSDVSFQLHRGEVLGIAGLVGSGRSEIGAALFGLRPGSHIDVSLLGRTYSPESPAEAIRAGLCVLPEERRSESIFPHMSTLENATIATLTRFKRHAFVDADVERSAAGPVFLRLNLSAANLNTPVSGLSGGNQQKAVMVRWLLAEPKVLFMDEPARGIDVGAKEQIYTLIDELARRGIGIILVSSEMPELLRCSDRVMVLCKGRQAGIVTVTSTSQEEILSLATGTRTGLSTPLGLPTNSPR